MSQFITLASHQIDPELFSEVDQITPRVAITFGELIDQLLYAGSNLGDDLLLFALPQRHFSAQRTFEQMLEAGCN